MLNTLHEVFRVRLSIKIPSTCARTRPSQRTRPKSYPVHTVRPQKHAGTHSLRRRLACTDIASRFSPASNTRASKALSLALPNPTKGFSRRVLLRRRPTSPPPLLEVFQKTNPTSNLLPSAFRQSQRAPRHLIKPSLW